MARLARALAAASLLALGAAGAAANHVVMHGGPFGGVVTQLVLDPRDPETLYVAAFGSGIYKSVDGGRTWRWASSGLDDPTVLALTPAASGVLYAGTDSGVFVSRDGGASWRRPGEGLAERNVRSLLAWPGPPPALYAATDQGILRSTDGGATWAWRNEGLDSRDIRVLRGDSTRPGRLYAAGFGGVYRTDDGGARWEAVVAGLSDRRVRALALDPRRPGTLYAGTAGRGVFVTSNGGVQWQPLTQGLRNLTVLSLASTETGERFAGTVGGVYRLAPSGRTWTLVGEDVLTLTITFVTASPHRPDRLYAGTGGLVFVSDDHGRQWRELAVSVAGRATVPAVATGASRPAEAEPQAEGR